MESFVNKIVLTDENGTYTIECVCGPTVNDAVDRLVVPVLLAAGYHRDSISKIIDLD
jgi:hypothetical protein